MLMMRLQRVGRRNEAHFKIVVIEKTKGPKSHRYVDILGSYNPKMGTVTLDEAAAKDWLSKGVQPSDTVFNMLVTKGLIEGRKKNVLPKKSPTKKRNAPDEEPEVKAPVSKPKADVAKEAPVVEDTTEEAPVVEDTTEEAPVEEASVIEEVTETEEAPAAEETPVEEKIEA